MTAADWQTYTSTIQAAKLIMDPTSNLSVWETAAKFHADNEAQIHWTCAFFFWHRYYLIETEQKLQKINPDFFFPWWNTTQVWNNQMSSVIWKHVGGAGSPVHGDIFGGKPMYQSVGHGNPLSRPFTAAMLGNWPSQTLYNGNCVKVHSKHCRSVRKHPCKQRSCGKRFPRLLQEQ